MKEYAHMIQHLMTYTQDKAGELSAEKRADVQTIYEIICSNISALKGSNYIMQQEAIRYFRSVEFVKHCKAAHISTKLMLHLVENAPKKNVYESSSK